MTLVSVTSVTHESPETIDCVDQGLCKRISHLICFICTMFLNGNSAVNMGIVTRSCCVTRLIFSVDNCQL